MARNRHNRLSLASAGTHREFLLGIALVSIIPFLVFLYLAGRSDRDLAGAVDPHLWRLLVLALVSLMAWIGFMVLRRHPIHLHNIRGHLQRRVHAEAADRAGFIEIGHDAASIQNGIDLIIAELKSRAQAAEQQKTNLERALARAQKLESLSTMATGMSHDLNNFLTAILGNIGLLQLRLPPGSPAETPIRQIEECSRAAMDLANALALFGGRAPLTAEPLVLSELIAAMKEHLEAIAGEGVTLRMQAGPDVPRVCGDAGQLRQAVLNVVRNAAEAMHGEGVVTVATGLRRCSRAELDGAEFAEGLTEGNYAFVEVTDTGAGIAPAVRERMFDPFYSSKLRGRGMGLAVTQGIVRAHGGAIAVRSRPGEGATITLLIPAQG